jgi:hypothetical protein
MLGKYVIMHDAKKGVVGGVVASMGSARICVTDVAGETVGCLWDNISNIELYGTDSYQFKLFKQVFDITQQDATP